MSDEQRTRMMACVYCGRTKAWPDAFPSTLYAVCWECNWNKHQEAYHPPKKHWRWQWPLRREVGVSR